MDAKNTIVKTYDGNKTIAYNWFEAMNTRLDIVICNVSETDFVRLTDAVKDKMMQFQFIANRFDPYSELSKINKGAFDRQMKVSKPLYDAIKLAMTYVEPTCGCFDITIQSAQHTADTFKNVCLNDADLSICFLAEHTVLDLNGFVKGYVLDWINVFLRDNGVTDAMINLGNSSILAIGNQPYGEGWNIAMNCENSTSQRTVKLVDECFTTSGNLTENDTHIIDPHRGTCVQGKRTVSVVTKLAAEGEALSTAFFVADDNAKRIIEGVFEGALLVDY